MAEGPITNGKQEGEVPGNAPGRSAASLPGQRTDSPDPSMEGTYRHSNTNGPPAGVGSTSQITPLCSVGCEKEKAHTVTRDHAGTWQKGAQGSTVVFCNFSLKVRFIQHQKRT